MKRYYYWLFFALQCLNVFSLSQVLARENYVDAASTTLEKENGNPPQSKEIVTKLNQLVTNLYRKGDYATGISVAEQMCQFADQKLGSGHPDTLSCISNLATLYQAQGRYSDAEPLFQRLLVVEEKTLGREHPDTLLSLNNLASLYQAQGRYSEAEPLCTRALKSNEKVFGHDDPNTILSVNNLALDLKSQGKFDEAEPLYQRALKSNKKVLGDEHPHTIISINNLASLYDSKGRFKEAEELYLRALEKFERAFGHEHPNTLLIINNLALLYQSQGQFGKAEQLFRRILATSEKLLGHDHPDTLRIINNLATLYQSQGRPAEAEPLFQRALATGEKKLGFGHPEVFSYANNLATLYQSQGRPDEAVLLFQQVLAEREKTLGHDHPDTITSANNLALSYKSLGQPDKAAPLFQRALSASEEVLGNEHPDTLSLLNNFAVFYDSQGRPDKAEPLFQRAIMSREKVLGSGHPDTLAVQLNYASTLVNLNQPGHALQLLERMQPHMLEYASVQLLQTQQENIRRLFLWNQLNYMDVVLNLALAYPESKYQSFAATVMLRWKQIQGEEEAFLEHQQRSGIIKDSKSIELSQKIKGTRRDFAHISNLPKPDKDQQQKKLRELETLEFELAKINHKFNRHLQVRNVNVEDVRQNLPEGGGLLELRSYHPINFKTREFDESHWIALLLPATGNILLKDIGPTAKTQHLVHELRAMHNYNVASELYNSLFGKIDDKLKGYNSLFIAPHGILSLLAFAELVVPDGRFWVQRQSLHQVATGRHLIASYDPNDDISKGLVALGDINYENYSTLDIKKMHNNTQKSGHKNEKLQSGYSEITRFKRLEQTGYEIEEVENACWGAPFIPSQVWRNEAASESRLKTITIPPHVLHLATHGFYYNSKDRTIDRPMVLSGLALAGANMGLRGKTDSNGEDGILYSLEIQNLNLENTELVTLSACDTGKGTVDESEGVYGLVRAFQAAGARNILMTLWSVQDASTREFMNRFYRNWMGGTKPKKLAEALRETQLSFIQDSEISFHPPNVWAPFVLVERQ